MSLINRMLRDLNARHATDAESALPDQVRPLSERSIPWRVFDVADLGRGGWLIVGLLALGGVGLLVVSPWSPQLATVAKPSPVPGSVVVPAPVDISDDLVPTLPSLTKTLPLAPPGISVSKATRTTPVPVEAGKGAPVSLKLDSMLTFNPNSARLPGVTESKPKSEVLPALKLSSSGAATVIQGERERAGKAEGPEKQEKVERIEKVARGERGDENFRNGVIAFKQGRTTESITRLNAALHENPSHTSARQALLGILVEQKRWDEALTLLQEGLDLMPEQIGWAMAMARIQVERGNTADAWEILQKHQSYAERNADYQGFAGVLLQYLKKPHEAVLRYKAALKLKPREGRWWYALGSALEADNQAAEAADAFRRAQTLGGLTPAMAEAIEKKLH